MCLPFCTCCLCALSALYISRFTPNSTAPPYCQSPPLFSACYVSSIDVTSPDTALGFFYSGGIGLLSSHLSEKQRPKTSSNCAQTLWWPLPMLHQIKCMTNSLISNPLFCERCSLVNFSNFFCIPFLPQLWATIHESRAASQSQPHCRTYLIVMDASQ